MEEEILIGSRKVKVKEIKYFDMISIDSNDRTEAMKKTFLLGTDLTEEEIKLLTFKEGAQLTKIINKLNGFGEKDFQ